MKIVINIPEELLNENMISVDVFPAKGTISDVNIFGRYADFIILPKGHGDLIDRDKIARAILPLIDTETRVYVNKKLYTVPTIIEADKGE